MGLTVWWSTNAEFPGTGEPRGAVTLSDEQPAAITRQTAADPRRVRCLISRTVARLARLVRSCPASSELHSEQVVLSGKQAVGCRFRWEATAPVELVASRQYRRAIDQYDSWCCEVSNRGMPVRVRRRGAELRQLEGRLDFVFSFPDIPSSSRRSCLPAGGDAGATGPRDRGELLPRVEERAGHMRPTRRADPVHSRDPRS